MCVSCEIFSSALCFVSAHLTAHRGAYLARNDDVRSILLEARNASPQAARARAYSPPLACE